MISFNLRLMKSLFNKKWAGICFVCLFQNMPCGVSEICDIENEWYWNRYTGTCLKVFRRKLPFRFASAFCFLHLAHLLEITKKQTKLDFLASNLPRRVRHELLHIGMWIVLRKEDIKSEGAILDKGNMISLVWIQQSTVSSEPGLYFQENETNLDASKSFNSYPFICEKRSVKVCSDGWNASPVSGTCIKTFHSEKHWEDAESECMANEADLMRIPFNDMNNSMWDHIDPDESVDKKKKKNYWIGLHSSDSKHFKWGNSSKIWRERTFEKVYVGPVPGFILRYLGYQHEFVCERPSELTCDGKAYGMVCGKKCSCNCFLEVCDAVTGVCNMCITGYQGLFCDQTCPNNTYGQNCTKRCSDNCASSQCSHINGSCLHGCTIGYEGTACDIALNDGNDTADAIRYIAFVIIVLFLIAFFAIAIVGLCVFPAEEEPKFKGGENPSPENTINDLDLPPPELHNIELYDHDDYKEEVSKHVVVRFNPTVELFQYYTIETVD